MTAMMLSDDLMHGDDERRAGAAQLLAAMGTDAAPAAAALVARASDHAAGEWCVAALEEMGPPSPADLESIQSHLESPNELSAYWAATLIGRLGPAAADAIATLERLATDDSPQSVRQRAVWALGKIGPAAASATRTLKTLSESSEQRMARLAEQAIASIEG